MPNDLPREAETGLPGRLHSQTLLKICALLLAAIPVLAMAQPRLLPAPREAHWAGEAAIPATITVSVPGHDRDDEFAARDLEEAVKQAEISGANGEKSAYAVILLRSSSSEAKTLLATRKLAFDAAMEEEGYLLVLDPHQAFIVGASASGVFYGVQTLKQLLGAPPPKTPQASAGRT